jgi:hypothetical protein
MHLLDAAESHILSFDSALLLGVTTWLFRNASGLVETLRQISPYPI